LFPVEGAVLDLWKPDKSRLQSRQDYIAESLGCDKSFQPCFPGSGHRDSIVQGDSIRLGKLRGMNITATDVFDSVEQETTSANVIVALEGGMIVSRTAMLASKLPERELVRLSNARTMSKTICIATASEYGQQAGRLWLEPVTCEGATAEIVCHADL
jgi:hypothetical protein